MRPRRSALYIPGSNTRALDKARTLPADVLILDLEDAVAPVRKAEARAQVMAAIAAGGYGRRELVVRVNGLDTPWGQDDLAAVAGSGADAVLLPKVDGPEQVQAAEALLQSGASDRLGIWCMLETPTGVLQAQAIASASPRLQALVMGTSDLAEALRCAHTPDRLPLLTSLSLCLLAARAAGLDILDGVHLDLDDEAGFEAICHQGAELGFDGKTLIHPKTLAAANRVFSPAADTLTWSQRVIEAYREALARGEAVVLVDGRLVEQLHVDEARRVVALAERIAEADRDDHV